MIAVTETMLSLLSQITSSPIYYLEITKSEGTTDPFSGSDEWPNNSATYGHISRIFIQRQPSWGNLVARVNDYQVIMDRMNERSIKQIVSSIHGSERKSGGLSSTDSVTVSLDNTDGAFGDPDDLKLGGIKYVGRKAQIYLTFDAVTDKADDILLFTGTVNDTQFKGDNFDITIESVDQAHKKKIPNRFYDVSDVTRPNSPQTVPVQAVFGQHDMVPGHTESDTVDTGSEDGGRLVTFCDIVDKTAIQAINSIWLADDSLVEVTGGFAEIQTVAANGMVDYTTYTKVLADAQVYFDLDEDDELFFSFVAQPISDLLYSNPTSNFTNPPNAYDGDGDTYALGAVTGSGVSKSLRLRLPTIAMDATIQKSGTRVGIYLHNKLYLTLTSTSWINILIGGENQDLPGSLSPYKSQLTPSDNGAHNSWSPPADILAWGMFFDGSDWDVRGKLSWITSHYLSFTIAQFGTGSSTLYNYDTALNLYCVTGFSDKKFYGDIDGYEDDGSGSYSGSASTMLENPCHIIPYIYHYFGEVDNADLDLDLCKQVATEYRDTWAFSKVIDRENDIADVIRKLAEQAFVWVWFDNEGTMKITAWSKDPTGYARKIYHSDVSGSELLSVKQSRLEEVITRFKFKYKYNEFRGDFDKLLFVKPDDSSSELSSYEYTCEWAEYDNGGYSKEEEFDLDWVRDSATAALVAGQYITYHTKRRWEIEFEADLKLITLQKGDPIRLDPDGAWATNLPIEVIEADYRITKVKIDPKRDIIRFTAVEVF
jgi:hypothetical protein